MTVMVFRKRNAAIIALVVSGRSLIHLSGISCEEVKEKVGYILLL
jgi:hypothetical protein